MMEKIVIGGLTLIVAVFALGLYSIDSQKRKFDREWAAYSDMRQEQSLEQIATR